MCGTDAQAREQAEWRCGACVVWRDGGCATRASMTGYDAMRSCAAIDALAGIGSESAC